MSRRFVLFFAVLACGAVAPAAHAQPQAGFRLAGGGPSDVPAKIKLSGQTLLQVDCTGVACTDLSAMLRVAGRSDAPVAVSGAPTAARIVFNLNSSMLGAATAGTVAVRRGGSDVATIPVEAGAAAGVAPVSVTGDGRDAEQDPGPSLGALLTRDCRNLLPRFQGMPMYDAAGDEARFVVTPVGNVLQRPGDEVDENDVVRVYVLGDPALVPRLAVSRISEFRTPGQVHYVGEDEDLNEILKSGRTGQDDPCIVGEYLVTDFAPGEKGEIELALVSDDGTQAPVGTFDFGVHTLFSGAFAFGPIRTELRNPTFGVVDQDGDPVVTVTEDGTPRVLYVLSFTPFIWGKRELEEPAPWYQHVNPTIGIVPAHLQDNAILGLSIDLLNSLYLQGGVHAGRVRRLDTRSGLEPGDEFTGDEVPTVREWDADWFVGVSMDLRAAVEFLRIAATGTGGG